ncbi:hypothetical protein BDV18DRAFT_100306 [Aspergillus unguis]
MCSHFDPSRNPCPRLSALGPSAAYKYPLLDPSSPPPSTSPCKSTIISKQTTRTFSQPLLKMSHGCSCGASCQCPAGQCNCPVSFRSTVLLLFVFCRDCRY